MGRFAFAIALVLSTALTVAPRADAKLCVAISAPRVAAAGSTILVRVTTFTPTWDGRRIVRRQPERVTFPVRLGVRDPSGSYREVRLRRTEDPAVLRATLALPLRGRWQVSVAGWEYAPRACAPTRTIRVR